MRWLLGPYAEGQTYRALFYLLIGLPLGIIEFTLIVTGLSVGAGLAITIIGIPILVGVLVMARCLAAMERSLTYSLLDARIPRIMAIEEHESAGWLARAWRIVKSGRTWTAVAYLLLRLPIGALDFTIAVTLIALMLIGPVQSILVAAGVHTEIGSYTIDTFAKSLVYWPISIIFALVGPRLLLAWSEVPRYLASALLGRVSRQEMKRVVAEVLGRLGEADGFAIMDELALRFGDGPWLTPTRVEASLLALVSNGYVTARQVGERDVYALREQVA